MGGIGICFIIIAQKNTQSKGNPAQGQSSASSRGPTFECRRWNRWPHGNALHPLPSSRQMLQGPSSALFSTLCTRRRNRRRAAIDSDFRCIRMRRTIDRRCRRASSGAGLLCLLKRGDRGLIIFCGANKKAAGTMTDQPKEEQDVSRPKAKPLSAGARGAQGWAEARTIIGRARLRQRLPVGTSSSTGWTLKETRCQDPRVGSVLVVAILFTTLTVIIILLAKSETTTTKTLPAPDWAK